MPNEQIKAVLAFLEGKRGTKSLTRRIHKAVDRLAGRRLSRAQLRKAYKGNIHDHIDCFPEYYTMLSMWNNVYGFDFSKVKFPQGLRAYWQAVNFDPSNVAFPAEVVSLWRGDGISKSLTGHARSAALLKTRRQAARLYGKFLVDYGSGSLFQYVAAIGVHILPVMQNEKAIKLILKQRLANAKKQGERMLELRGAPQLHTWEGMSMRDAVLAYRDGIAGAEIPVGLILCALRHEDDLMAWQVAKLCCEFGATFDLAADEAGKPGFLRGFMHALILVLLFGGKFTIHLWETNDPTDEDLRNLDAVDGILPQVKAVLAKLGIDVRDVLTSPVVEKQVSEIIEASIASVLDHKLVTLETSQGEVVLCPDLHVPARHEEIMQSLERATGVKQAEPPRAPGLAKRLGHGIRGKRQGDRFCEVCFSSNVVTGQVKSIAEHPGHEMWQRGVLVVPCTDGTTLIGINGLLDEFERLQDSGQGWDAARFLTCALLCIMASSFDDRLKLRMARECLDSFEALVA